MSAKQSQLDVITEPAAFRALQREWEDLWQRAGGQYHQAFSVCWLCWVHVAKPRGQKLRCIVRRERGRLVMVWPLVSYRRLCWTVLHPLTPGTIEHTSVLVEEGPTAPAMIAEAWRDAMRLCRADVCHLPYVSLDSPLHALASAQPGVKFDPGGPAAMARLSKEPDWEAFCNSLGTFSGRKPGARERRLAKEGDVVVRVLGPDDAGEYETWVDWILASKREWADRTDKKGPWLYSSGYRDFLLGLLDCADGGPVGRLFVVTLDGAPVAASMVGLGKDCVAGLITGFEQKLAKFGPGTIVLEHCVKWALQRRLDMDFGVGPESFKGYWSRDNFVSTWSFQIPVTAWGAIAFRARDLARIAIEAAQPPRRHVVGTAQASLRVHSGSP